MSAPLSCERKKQTAAFIRASFLITGGIMFLASVGAGETPGVIAGLMLVALALLLRN